MNAPLDLWLTDPDDAARYAGLAVLLGRLRSQDERERFAALYRRDLHEDEAQQTLGGLLDAAAALWSREERVMPAPRVASREVARVA